MAKVETELTQGILVVTLNNPPRNVLSNEVIRALMDLEPVFFSDEVRAVIFTGAKRLFCAGADVEEIPGIANREVLEAYTLKTHTFFETLASIPKPLIAAINGTCLGGGLELALCCHFRILSERGMIGLPEITLGLIPGWGGTQRLPRVVGEGKALEMIATGDTLSPQEALACGLVHKVVPRKEVLHTSKAFAEKLLAHNPHALARALRATRAALALPISAGLELERTFFAELWERNIKRPSPEPTAHSESAEE